MPTALLSVWDKRGLVEFASKLDKRGWELIASGGTARSLTEAGLPVTPVSRYTGEAEMFDGRVKTLHPAIHAGLLARNTPEDQAALKSRGWALIDMVVVNLYPFKVTTARPDVDEESAIEMIDIGGVALLRAGAKNYTRVTVICDPEDYPRALNPDDPTGFRLQMARKAFGHTADYDAAVQSYFHQLLGEPAPLRLSAYPTIPLRYGENPHQEAVFYSLSPAGGPLGGQQIQGKPLSYNNLLDMDAAWRAVQTFDQPAVVVVKHLSPCGIATAPTIAGAISPARESDPVSAFGSVIAANREIDDTFVHALEDLFIEGLIAPGFNSQARELLARSSNLRAVRMQKTVTGVDVDVRSITGGYLQQDVDSGDPPGTTWRVVSARGPDDGERAALHFAWHAVQPVKSNAVVFARSEGDVAATVGIGGGQPNRVDCVRIAGERAGERARGAVMASDAFFPFPDGIEAAASLGITAVIQPGGSIRDEEVIAAVDAAGMAMIFTGVRHFRH
jgi:phosphoribosylaminoimidazolecarboxamide formyltransferase/IMP cyclohydrolase